MAKMKPSNIHLITIFHRSSRSFNSFPGLKNSHFFGLIFSMSGSILKALCRCQILFIIAVTLVIQGCATTPSPPADPLAYKNRTESITNGDVNVNVAVPTIAEAQAIYGVALYKQNIQPVWVEVKNDSSNTYWLLPSSIDPEYFSPSDAAFAFHGDNKDKNQALDKTFRKMQFRNSIPAGASLSGFVLSNLDEGFKAVDVDLISQQGVKNYSFIIVDPDFRADHKEVNSNTIYAAEDIIHIETEEDLRRTLEELPCCTTNEKGDKEGDPLNLILIGDTHDIVPALVRRNWHATEVIWSKAIRQTINSFLKGEPYRYSPISPLYVFGRKQDIAWQKARTSINERNHMRFWLSPIRFQGKRVFVGQISRDIGVKFTLKSPTISTHVIDPDVDEARRYFVEDMAYSQTVSSRGYLSGVGRIKREAPKINLVGDPYYTDGLRAVLFFEPRPYDLSEIELLKWEIPPALFTDTNTGDSAGEAVTTIETQVIERAQTSSDDGIRTSTAVVGDIEAQGIFGIDLSRKKIQAVWLEVENNSDRPIVLLPTSIDPNYFSPLEVAFAYHKAFSRKTNATLDKHLLQLNFPTRSQIDPGSTVSGYIFTNWNKGLKVIDIDLIGHQFIQNFTFIVSSSDTSKVQNFIDHMKKMYSPSELEPVKSEAELRLVLERLACCVASEDGIPTHEPLNVVLVGNLEDWISAFVRRGYQSQPLSPRYAFGRPQDVSIRKQDHWHTKTQAHTIRLWQTPIRYLGMPVWAGQASSRLGGRFADREPLEKTLPMSPFVDEVRIDLTQDLTYSQGLIKFGHVKGAGRILPEQTNQSPDEIRYSTDGLRVVLVFGDRPVSLDEIVFFDWERLTDYR